jgi:hypothetical protein
MSALAAETVGTGRIVGGWGYVWACYGLTWGAFTLYAFSLWLRRPKLESSKRSQ